jgi:hypothetical protein
MLACFFLEGEYLGSYGIKESVAKSVAENRSRGHISTLLFCMVAERRFATDPSMPPQGSTCKDCAFNVLIFAETKADGYGDLLPEKRCLAK